MNRMKRCSRTPEIGTEDRRVPVRIDVGEEPSVLVHEIDGIGGHFSFHLLGTLLLHTASCENRLRNNGPPLATVSGKRHSNVEPAQDVVLLDSSQLLVQTLFQKLLASLQDNVSSVRQ